MAPVGSDAKFAARPERPLDPETRLRNDQATRVSDVDTSHVVPLRDLPELPHGTTSQRTGEHADYTYRRHDPDWMPPTEPTPAPTLPVSTSPARPWDLLDAPPVVTLEAAAPPPPAGYTHIARFPLISITSGKFNGRGDLDITFRVSVDDVDKVMPMWRLRRDGYFFYMDAYGLAFDELDGFGDHDVV